MPLPPPVTIATLFATRPASFPGPVGRLKAPSPPPPVDQPPRLPARPRRTVSHHAPRPLAGQQPRDPLPDAAPPPRHNRHFVCNPPRHPTTPFVSDTTV